MNPEWTGDTNGTLTCCRSCVTNEKSWRSISSTFSSGAISMTVAGTWNSRQMINMWEILEPMPKHAQTSAGGMGRKMQATLCTERVVSPLSAFPTWGRGLHTLTNQTWTPATIQCRSKWNTQCLHSRVQSGETFGSVWKNKVFSLCWRVKANLSNKCLVQTSIIHRNITVLQYLKRHVWQVTKLQTNSTPAGDLFSGWAWFINWGNSKHACLWWGFRLACPPFIEVSAQVAVTVNREIVELSDL